ncbi:MAG: hypothetical protein H7Z14_10775 [Anaerolineae bacterium]|nr:hypothetical protein [Phycisphaerae bacterium]
MSDKADKKKDAPEADAKAPKKKAGIAALLTKLPVLLGGVMMIEAVVLFAGFKMLAGGPKEASAQVDLAEHGDEGAAGAEHGDETAAADGHGDAPADAGHGDGAATEKKEKIDPKKQYELALVEFRAPNKGTGRTFLYDVSIYAVVKGSNKVKVEKAIKERGALIKDRVRTIIAQSDPEKLGGGSEPGLETLRRQVKFHLDEIVGDGYVEEVLVPRCIPFRTDF